MKRNFRFFYFTFAICLFISICLFQIESDCLSLTLDEAIHNAIENRYELKVADSNTKQAIAELGNAKSKLYPRIDISCKSRYLETINKYEPIEISFINLMEQEFRIFPSKAIPNYQSSISIEATQMLYSGGEIESSIKSARARIDKCNISELIEKRKIILSVTIAYWKLKECEGLLTAENKSSEQFGIIFNMAKLKYDKGTISRLEKDRAETALIDSYIDLIRAETEKEKALDTLLKEMGIENKQDYSICLSDEPEKEVTPLPYKLEKYIETALSKRPEILQVKKEILAKESDLRAVKSEYYPHVDLIGNYSWIGYDHSDLEGAWEDIQGDSWSIFMVLKYNLFQGFSTKNKTRKAQLSLSAEKSEFEGCSKSIILEVKNAYNEVIGKGREIEKARKTILLAENNLAAAMKQWELGVVTIEKVAEDNISLAKTRKRYINILIDLEIAKAKLKWATGEEIQ